MALALCERAMRRMRSGVGRSRSTVKPDGTSDDSELGSRTGHGKENVFCRYGHPSRIIHRAAPKVLKNLFLSVSLWAARNRCTVLSPTVIPHEAASALRISCRV